MRQAGSLSLLTLALISPFALGCSSPPDPGAVRFRVHTAPPPDDALLSPLTDPRASAIELRDGKVNMTLATGRFDALPAGNTPNIDLDLGSIGVSEPRDLRMLALGTAGQQVLGLALSRNVSWGYGSQTEVVLELRRPLVFFGGSSKLIAPVAPPQASFAPNQQIYAPLRDESKLRVIDPNAANPLISQYDLQFDKSGGLSSPVIAAAGTFDGQSLLTASQAGKLHVVDTLKLEDRGSIDLDPSLPAQSIVIDPQDRAAVLLSYLRPPQTTGRVGRILFIRDLGGLRSRTTDGSPLSMDVQSSVAAPLAPPIAATYAPSGRVEVLHAPPPLSTDQPDCNVLSGDGKAILRSYDPMTGAQMEEISLPYTTAVSYNDKGERVLVQPCTLVPGAKRPGRVVIGADRIVLRAPGVTDIAVVGDALVTVGADDVVDDRSVNMRAAVRVLEPNTNDWRTSYFDLPIWTIPFNITSGIPHAVSILLAPTDVMSYGIAVTPDRARALVLLRVQHRTFPGSRGVFIFDDDTANVTCYMKWSGYTYHVASVNLQSGSREQDYVVGVQNQSCRATFYNDTTGNDTNLACFSACGPATSPYLNGYQDGYIPSAASVLFGRR
jgi:hypothetical protein